MVGIGFVAYVKYVKNSNPQRNTITSSISSYSIKQQNAESYSCLGKVYCSEMTSCDEAKFYQRTCPGTKMDGDGDNIPCESQWCTWWSKSDGLTNRFHLVSPLRYAPVYCNVVAALNPKIPYNKSQKSSNVLKHWMRYIAYQMTSCRRILPDLHWKPNFYATDTMMFLQGPWKSHFFIL